MNTHNPYKELTARIELLNRLIRENNEECDVEERIPSHIQSTAEELTDLAKPFASAPALYEALKEIALDLYPPTDSHGCCLECGAWTPRNHAEAHNHEDHCKANQRYEARRNPRDIARAALASATPQGK